MHVLVVQYFIIYIRILGLVVIALVSFKIIFASLYSSPHPFIRLLSDLLTRLLIHSYIP